MHRERERESTSFSHRNDEDLFQEGWQWNGWPSPCNAGLIVLFQAAMEIWESCLIQAQVQQLLLLAAAPRLPVLMTLEQF
jgi:hypothetical protein